MRAIWLKLVVTPSYHHLFENILKRLHYADSTRIESVHLLMDGARKPQNPKYLPCDHTGYMATHGWDDKNEAMQINLIFYGPKFKANITEEQIGRVQNVEVYKLLLDLLEIPSDSNQLNTSTTSQTFSEWGKFAPVLKSPFHQPPSEKTTDNWPMVPEDEKSHFVINGKSINDTRHKSLIWSDRKGLANFLDNGLKAPFWWNSMLEMIETVAKHLELDVDDRMGFRISYRWCIVYTVYTVYINGASGIFSTDTLSGTHM